VISFLLLELIAPGKLDIGEDAKFISFKSYSTWPSSSCKSGFLISLGLKLGGGLEFCLSGRVVAI
jgi:hypothetical protein